MRRTKEQTELTRQTILDAAADLFMLEGFRGASLNQIAASAGVTRGAIHFHFTDRLGLLFALAERELAVLIELLVRVERDSPDPLGDLAQTCEAILVMLDQQPKRRTIVRALLVADARIRSKVGMVAFEQSIFEVEHAIFSAAESSGELAAPWTRSSATAALHSLMRGIITTWSPQYVPLVPDGVAAARALVDTFGKRRNSAARRRREFLETVLSRPRRD